MPKVLHIFKGLGIAGAERHLLILLSLLRERDIDAQMLLWVSPTQPADDLFAAAQAAGIPIERWVMPRHIAPGFFIKLWRYLRKNKPDIVHTHLVHAETYAIPAARLAGVRSIVNSSHNDDPFRRRAIFRGRSRILWRMTSRGIAISDYIKQFLVEIEGAKLAQVQVIHYGLSFDEQAPSQALDLPPDAQIVGSVCRLVPQKGITDAIAAIAQLADEYPRLHYVIVGDGNLRAELEAQAAPLKDRIHFLGWRADAAQLMRSFDIFLAPSLWEGFGMVFLEAMAQARPIVTTNVSSIPEVVIDGETGYLVPPQNPTAIADALRQLLDDPNNTLGQAGQNRLLEYFSPARMADQTAALYREILS